MPVCCVSGEAEVDEYNHGIERDRRVRERKK